MLQQSMQRVAAAGQLRESLERACARYHAAAVGVVMSLLATLSEQRGRSLSPAVRDHTLSGITASKPLASPATTAVTANQLRALLGQVPVDASAQPS